MKRVILILMSMMTFSMVYSQNINADRYVLYPTKNIWTFLKLDTSNGKVWQVQYSVEGADYRFETTLNNTALVLDEDSPAGRFKLYPTDNTYSFVLIDTKIGTTYQVQWSQDSDERMMLPISSDAPLVWSCGYARVHKDSKSNYIDTAGCYLFDKWYDDCALMQDGYFKVGSKGKYNIADSTGKYILTEWYDYCGGVIEGFVVISNGDKWNYADAETGLPISQEWFDGCKSFSEQGTAEVKIGNKWYLIDKKGTLQEQ